MVTIKQTVRQTVRQTVKNPYILGQPVKNSEMFFGREDVFDFLRQRLVGTDHSNAVMLYGQRRTGKTSILYQIRDANRLGSGYFPVLVSLEGLQDIETNAKLFLEIARVVARALKLERPAENKFDPANSYFRYDFLESVKEHLGEQKLLLMIDEYETLEACVNNPETAVNVTLFHQLRHLMQHFEWLSFILVGSHKLDELNPAYWKEFTGATYHTTSFLDSNSARRLIQEPAYKESIVYTPQAVERLLESSGHHPYFLQALCQFAFEQGAHKGKVDGQDVEQAIEPAIMAIRLGYESIWQDLKADEQVVLATMSSLDVPAINLSDIAGQLDYFKVNWKLERITKAIQQLVFKDVLQKNGRYRYCVPFFEACVKTYHSLDKILDDLGLERKTETKLIADPKVLKAEQYLRDAEEQAQQNNVDMAVNMFEAATKVCADYVDSWLRFGKFYEARQQNEKALKLYREVLQQHPEWVRVSNALGLLLKKSEKYEPALQQFQRSRDIQTDNATALANIAEIEYLKTLAEEAGHQVIFTGHALLDVGQSSMGRPAVRAVITDLMETMQSAACPIRTRHDAGDLLGRLGDPREGISTLPPLLTSPIRGKFLYGQDKVERAVEPFQAGVYLVTNAQFAYFIKAGGYDKAEWWSKEGWQYRQRREWTQPQYWDNIRWNNLNHPVVGVSWYEAEAFCNWLTTEYGRPYRLPTEKEWERLARGRHGREYPWGNKWLEGVSNTYESEINQTTAVGLFPRGVSPTGAYDCAGNVWEWTIDKDENDWIWLRGGSWLNDRKAARVSSRSFTLPDFFYGSLGFRVLVAPVF